MKVLILGATGMLGHKLYQQLSGKYDVTGTVRSNFSSISKYGFFNQSRIITDFNVQDISNVERTIKKNKTDIIINCIGIVKSISDVQGRLVDIWINALFPQQLYEICKGKGIRLIHISTDCVFSGKRGHYKEDDLSDAEDIYGKTKYLGEITKEDALTIRTSLIGRELSNTYNLVEWFLSNQGGTVNGFTNAIFSGFPTTCFAQIIDKIILKEQNLSGVYHISSEPISKYKLLTLIRDKMELNIKIKEDLNFYCDRSLDSSRYQAKTGFKARSWEQMIDEFTQDAQQYQQWRIK